MLNSSQCEPLPPLPSLFAQSDAAILTNFLETKFARMGARLKKLVLRNKPLSWGNGGKPHWADFCCRTGGEKVYACSHVPNGVIRDQI